MLEPLGHLTKLGELFLVLLKLPLKKFFHALEVLNLTICHLWAVFFVARLLPLADFYASPLQFGDKFFDGHVFFHHDIAFWIRMNDSLSLKRLGISSSKTRI